MSRKVPRRRHVRKTKNGRTIVRRHSMNIKSRRRYQAKRDWVGYQRVRQKQRSRNANRIPLLIIDTDSKLVSEFTSSSQNGVSSTLLFEDRVNDAWVQIDVDTNTPVKEIQIQKSGKQEAVNVLESDGDFLTVTRKEEPLALE